MKWCSERLRSQGWNVSEAEFEHKSQALEPSLPLPSTDPLRFPCMPHGGPLPGPALVKCCEDGFLFLGGVGAEGFLYWGDKRARLG